MVMQCTSSTLRASTSVHTATPQAGRIAEAEGAAALVLHARTADQLYASPVDWAAVRALVEAVRIPVVGNGDVFEGADALRLLRETGCAGACASGAAGPRAGRVEGEGVVSLGCVGWVVCVSTGRDLDTARMMGCKYQPKLNQNQRKRGECRQRR